MDYNLIYNTGYEILFVGFSVVVIAQILKFFSHLIVKRTADFRMFTTTGGMPSSHAAGVMGLSTSVGLIQGFSSIEFAIAFGYALIVMYDAAGLRRSEGQMATQLNMLVDALYEQRPHSFRNKLIELLGHTPLEVTMGALLGISMSILLHYAFKLG